MKFLALQESVELSFKNRKHCISGGLSFHFRINLIKSVTQKSITLLCPLRTHFEQEQIFYSFQTLRSSLWDGGCRVQGSVPSFPTFSLSGSCLCWIGLISEVCSAGVISTPCIATQPFPRCPRGIHTCLCVYIRFYQSFGEMQRFYFETT